MTFQNSNDRFSLRAEHYALYRPGYPTAAIDFVEKEFALPPGGAVADLGSGTGILSEVFLKRGYGVWGVEPNGDMRAVAERLLGDYSGFHSMGGNAESSGLDSDSVDAIIAGQAFHWFDAAKTRIEIEGVLKPGGRRALLWNNRLLEGTPFLCAYEKFLRDWGADYESVSEEYEKPSAIEMVLGPGYVKNSFENYQDLDRAGLRGRILSASYMPSEHEAGAAEMLEALDAMHASCAVDGMVRIEYETNVYIDQAAD